MQNSDIYNVPFIQFDLNIQCIHSNSKALNHPPPPLIDLIKINCLLFILQVDVSHELYILYENWVVVIVFYSVHRCPQPLLPQT
jgi:hypothetical protein